MNNIEFMTPLLNICVIITTIFIILYIAVSPMNRMKSTYRKNYMNKYDVQHSAIGTVTWLIYAIASIALVVYISSLGTFINSLSDVMLVIIGTILILMIVIPMLRFIFSASQFLIILHKRSAQNKPSFNNKLLAILYDLNQTDEAKIESITQLLSATIAELTDEEEIIVDLDFKEISELRRLIVATQCKQPDIIQLSNPDQIKLIDGYASTAINETEQLSIK